MGKKWEHYSPSVKWKVLILKADIYEFIIFDDVYSIRQTFCLLQLEASLGMLPMACISMTSSGVCHCIFMVWVTGTMPSGVFGIGTQNSGACFLQP